MGETDCGGHQVLFLWAESVMKNGPIVIYKNSNYIWCVFTLIVSHKSEKAVW